MSRGHVHTVRAAYSRDCALRPMSHTSPGQPCTSSYNYSHFIRQ